MAEFKVTFAGMQNVIDRQKQIDRLLIQAGQEVAAISRSLDFKVVARAQIQRRLAGSTERMGQLRSSNLSMQSGLRTVLQHYQRTEQKLAGKSALAVESGLPGVIDNPYNAWEREKQSATSVFGSAAVAGVAAGKAAGGSAQREKPGFWDKIGSSIQKAVGNAVQATKDCVSAIKESYDNKGVVYTVAQYGKAAVKVVGGIGAVAAAVASGGALAPVAGAYGVNSIISGVTDAVKITKNVAEGKTAEIDETNLLKSLAAETGGAIGGALGDEKAGRAIGEAIYHTGEVATTLYSIHTGVSKITQASDINLAGISGEIKTIPRGVWDLAAKTDIGQLKYQTQLFKYTIPNTVEAVENIALIGGLSGDLIGGTGDLIQGLVSGDPDSFGGLYGEVQDTVESVVKAF